MSLTYKLLFHNFTFNQQKFQIFYSQRNYFYWGLVKFQYYSLYVNLKFVTICWNFHTDTFKTMPTLCKLYFSIVIFFLYTFQRSSINFDIFPIQRPSISKMRFKCKFELPSKFFQTFFKFLKNFLIFAKRVSQRD